MTDPVSFIMSWFILALGLSYLLQQKMWLKLIDEFLNESSRYILLPMMMFLLVFGLAVIISHNIWEMSARVVITVFGWSMAIKGALYMIWPRFGERSIRYFLPFMERWLQISGALITLLGTLLVYQYGLAL